jgi:DNA repair protein RadD
MIELRAYQKKGLQMLYDAIREGHKRIIWNWPTGAGKSTVSSRLVKACIHNEKKVLFFVHSKELVQQFSARLWNQFHIPSGIIMAGVSADRTKLCQVASVQTLARRKLPDADVVIIDETHRAKAKTYTKILKNYPDAIVIGLTATPFRGDGKGLSDIFEKIVQPVKVRELIQLGHLVGTVKDGRAYVYGPANPVNLTGIKTVAGDYDKKEMADRFGQSNIVSGVLDNWNKHAKGKKTIVFNVNVEHSKKVTEKFKEAGISAAHLDGKTPKQERARVVQQFKKGTIQVLSNVNLFTEGFDIPDTECVILNRATKSMGLYIQMVGRGLRPAPGKEVCIVLDHGGNTIRHGFVEDYDQRPFSLDGIAEKDKKKKKEEDKTKFCPECLTVSGLYEPVCKTCGFEFPRKRKEIRFRETTGFVALDYEATIIEFLMGLRWDKIDKIPFSQLRIYAILKGYKRGWWFHKAIELGYVNIDKDHPYAFRTVKTQIELAEVEAGTDDLYKRLKKETENLPEGSKAKKHERTIQRSNREAVRS